MSAEYYIQLLDDNHIHSSKNEWYIHDNAKTGRNVLGFDKKKQLE